MAAYLSARQAADLCGVSERTIRNWIASGKLSAEKSAGTFRIDRDQLEAIAAADAHISAGAERNGADSANIPQTPSADPSAIGPAMLELVHLVAQLQSDVVQKAEAAAMWQSRAEFLAGQLEQAQLALAAPKEPTPSKIGHTSDSVGVSVEPTQTPAKTPQRAPWWMPWRRVTS
jgi:excisionase family DNA binding protein